MAYRRCLQALTRQAHDATTFLFTHPSPSLRPFPTAAISSPISTNPRPISAFAQWCRLRYFSTSKQDDHVKNGANSEDDDGDEDDYSDEEDDEDEVEYDDGDYVAGGSKGKKVLTAEEKEAEAAAIGYKVEGPLLEKDGVFKPYEPVFAVVQVQFANLVSFWVLLFCFLFVGFTFLVIVFVFCF